MWKLSDIDLCPVTIIHTHSSTSLKKWAFILNGNDCGSCAAVWNNGDGERTGEGSSLKPAFLRSQATINKGPLQTSIYFRIFIACTSLTLDSCNTPRAAPSSREAFGVPVGLSWAGRRPHTCLSLCVPNSRHVSTATLPCILILSVLTNIWKLKKKNTGNRPKSKNRRKIGFFKASSSRTASVTSRWAVKETQPGEGLFLRAWLNLHPWDSVAFYKKV